MKFEIRINENSDKKPVLTVFLFSRSDDYYLDGGQKGIYNFCVMAPDDNFTLLSLIENGVNACLADHEKSLQKYFDEIVGLNEEKIKDFQRRCGQIE